MKHVSNFEVFSLFESAAVNENDLNYSPNGPIRWNSTEKTFSVYASDAEIGVPKKELSLSYQGKTIRFKQTKVDMDGSGEDTYGWWYESTAGSKFPCKLLIIND
jgi:hypothetical protein